MGDSRGESRAKDEQDELEVLSDRSLSRLLKMGVLVLNCVVMVVDMGWSSYKWGIEVSISVSLVCSDIVVLGMVQAFVTLGGAFMARAAGRNDVIGDFSLGKSVGRLRDILGRFRRLWLRTKVKDVVVSCQFPAVMN